MIPDQELGQGDTAPDFEKQLQDADGTFPDLIGTTVTCRVILPSCCGVQRPISTPANIIDARGGYVGHTWAIAETANPGLLLLYFVVERPNTAPVAYPAWGYFTARIKARLA